MGDGACTVIRGRFEGFAVIDCGSTSLRHHEPCERLLEAIANRPEQITTIVVTHFDADHYWGFLRLAEQMELRGLKFSRLLLVAPRPPDVEMGYTSRLLALEMMSSGLPSLDLADALRRVTADGQFTYRPVARRQRFTFETMDFDVHWPPAILPNDVTRQVRNAIRRFEDLAEVLRDRGISMLDDNLAVARQGSWLSNGDQTVGQRRYEDNFPFEDPDLPYDDREAGDIQFRHRDDHDHDHDGRVLPLDIQPVGIPEDLAERFRTVRRAFSRANNNMSIVFDDEQANLIVFGDAEPQVLRQLMRTNGLGNWYRVMLAPHHGTHRLPAGFNVGADLCVSQNGNRRHHLWDNHLSTHDQARGNCVSTKSGNHHVPVGWFSPHWCPCCY